MTAEQNAQQQDWFKTQQQYWDVWLQGQRQFFDGQNPASGLGAQWESFFREWQNLTTGAGTPAADSYRSFFTQAGKSYLDLVEKFYQADSAQSPDATLKAWTDNLKNFYDGLLRQSAQPFSANGNANVQAWENFFKNAAGPQGSFQAAPLFDPFGFAASIPGIGYTREKQDSFNHLYQLWSKYEAEMRRYNSEMAAVSLEALKAFQDYVTNPPKDAHPLESLKDIYIKFVDIAEEVFAKYAMSDEYIKLYGDVVNALTAFKKQVGVQADEFMEQINLPSRSEVDTLHKRVHEMRRENQQLKQEIAEIKSALGLGAKAAKAPAPVKTPAAKTGTKPAVKKGKKK